MTTTRARSGATVEVRARALVEMMRAYAAPAAPGRIDLYLDANEGPTPGPAALRAAGSLSPELLRRYPKKTEVEALLAARFGRSPGEVIVTAGGDDALDRCCRAVLEPGRTLVMPVPTFEMIGRSARIAGAHVVEVEWPDGSFPAEELLDRADEQTGMIAVVSPNNPTGCVAPSGAILSIAQAAPRVLIVVDFAYIEFASVDPTAQLLEAPNVVVVRTFSKAMGLAGLRLGYALGQERVIDWLRTVGSPYPTSGPSLAVAEAVLHDGFEGADHASAYAAMVRGQRQSLRRLLIELGFNAPPSEANFVLARHPLAAGVHAGLLRRGISVRAFPGVPRLDDALRITCPGDDAGFRRLARSLRAVVEELKQ